MVVPTEIRLRYRKEKARGLKISVGDNSGPVAPTGTYDRTLRPCPALYPTSVLLPVAEPQELLLRANVKLHRRRCHTRHRVLSVVKDIVLPYGVALAESEREAFRLVQVGLRIARVS